MLELEKFKEESNLVRLIVNHYGLSVAEQVLMFEKMATIAEENIATAMQQTPEPHSRSSALLVTEASLRLAVAYVMQIRHAKGEFVSVERQAMTDQGEQSAAEIPDAEVVRTWKIELDTAAALALLQMIQIGLQHPLSSGIVAGTCRKIGEEIAAQLVGGVPQLEAVIKLGWEGVIR